MLKFWLAITKLTSVLLVIQCYSFAQEIHRERAKSSPHFFHDSRSTSYHVMVKDSLDFKAWMIKNLPNAVLKSDLALKNVYLISSLAKKDLGKLLEAPELKFAEVATRFPSVDSDVPGLDLTVNAINAVHHLYPSLSGEGLRVLVKENALDKNDLDLIGRVYGYESVPDVADPHATLMATIISGAGNTSPESKGVAWRSSPGFSDFGNLMPESTAGLVVNGICVQNHSYGVGVENFYGIESHAYDRQCVEYPRIVHVFSAGNSGMDAANSGVYDGITGYANLTGQFKVAKNIMTVGSIDQNGVIDPVSSRGPASDGRVKPELMAYGIGGTSEAAAIVSGICLLVQEAYKNLTDTLPHSSLVRAALLNSADDAGSDNVDFLYGFGVADALGAVETIAQTRFFASVSEQGSEEMFAIDLPANVYRLKVTMVWNDPPADPGSDAALVNDLDLVLIHESSAQTYKPWVSSSFPHLDSLKKPARRAEDHTNNAEQITVIDPQPGAYTIKVKGYDIPAGTQPFSVVFESSAGLQWVYPTASDAVEADKQIYIRWKWDQPEAVATAEWKISGTDDWIFLGNVPLSQQFYEWLTPDVNEIIDLRLVLDGQVLAAENFVVSHQPVIKTGYNCEDDALVFWDGEALQTYRLYKLSGSFFDDGIVVSDTAFVIHKDEEAATHLSVAPAIQGRPGVRSRSIRFDSDINDCYIKSFIARELVTDSVFLDVILGTSLGLKAIHLERQTPGGFSTVQSFSPVEEILFSMSDDYPLPGRNRYRLRVERLDHQAVYSQTEDVWYTRDENLLVYPNPCVTGDELSVIVNSDSIVMGIYDVAGHLIRETTEDGEIKNISTTGLRSGVYIIRAAAPSGRILTEKIILR